jgi:hypothetical protein
VTGIFAAAMEGRIPAVYSEGALLIGTASYVAVTFLFYYIFKPVNKTLSLIAALFSLVGCTISTLGTLHLTPPNVVNPLVFFGFYCLLIGYLTLRSTFLPRTLGVLIGLAGLGWLTFLAPTFADSIATYLMALGAVGEGALMLWLLAFGVNAQRWNEQASAPD